MIPVEHVDRQPVALPLWNADGDAKGVSRVPARRYPIGAVHALLESSWVIRRGGPRIEGGVGRSHLDAGWELLAHADDDSASLAVHTRPGALSRSVPREENALN